MGSLQLILLRRHMVSKALSSGRSERNRNWELLLLRHLSQSSSTSARPSYSRGFRSNSVDDDVGSSRRMRQRDERATAPDSAAEFFPSSSSRPRDGPNRDPESSPGRPLRDLSSSFNQSLTRDRNRRPSTEANGGEYKSPVGADKSSHTSILEFLKKDSSDQARRDTRTPSQKDNTFLEKFKLGVDKGNDDVNKEKSELNSKSVAAESQQDKPQQPSPDADEIFKKMKETGLIPNAVAMLDGLCKDGLVKEALNLFGLMREKGTIPEVVIYTAVVEGFCKAEKPDDAIRIFRKMQSNGITPNAFSYTVLVQGLYKCNRLEDAISYSQEMLESGHSPNVTTFVGLVDGLCKEKGIEEAQNVIASLKQKGFFINEKAVREFLDKKAPFSSTVWEAIFGKKPSQKLF